MKIQMFQNVSIRLDLIWNDKDNKIGTLDDLRQVGNGIKVLDGNFLKESINVGDGTNILGGKVYKKI